MHQTHCSAQGRLANSPLPEHGGTFQARPQPGSFFSHLLTVAGICTLGTVPIKQNTNN